MNAPAPGGTLFSVAEARALLREWALPLRRTTRRLEDACGWVLARDVRTDRDLPPFDRAAVDGYAVVLAGAWREGTEFRILAEVAAGSEWRGHMRSGTAVKVMTGAPVPRGADGVVMVERSERVSSATVRLFGAFERGSQGQRPGLAARGEDARRGEVVVRAGTRIHAAHLAVLASVGCVDVPVMRRPTVAILSTGPELVSPAQKPGRAQIRNSNASLLGALLAGSGAAVLERQISVPDSLPKLEKAIAKVASADVIVATGGVSMGDFDFVPRAFADAGYTPRFHRVALRPGKPIFFATRGRGAARRAAFGLPGNPISVLVTAWEFLLPYLRAGAGRVPHEPFAIPAVAAERVSRKPGLTQFVLASFERLESGHLGVRPVPWNGSGDFLAASRAQALLELPAEDPVLEQGSLCYPHALFQEGFEIVTEDGRPA